MHKLKANKVLDGSHTSSGLLVELL